ncbi:PucR family transcriptional regulator [Virgibacillus byunsanensis]|uniref:PucR family transcriptional regulator n=1 Tax=Virgibacillus byunsanensis TaxID=570945 RepID=A0ABW3LPY7_9BACI
MIVKIKDILKMSEMKGTTILAGQNGLDRIVESTTVLDAPDAIKWLKGKELAFTSTYPLLNSEERLDVMIQELAIRNVSGLGVKLNRYMKKLPDEMISAANEYNFPIICLPNEKAWIDLITPIMSKILKLRTNRLIRSEEVNKCFTNALLANTSVEDMLKLLYKYIENPFSIFILSDNELLNYPSMEDNQNIKEIFHHFDYYFENKTKVINSKHNIFRLYFDHITYIIFPLENNLKQGKYIIIEEFLRKLNLEDIDCLLHAKNAFLIKDLNQKSEREFKKKDMDGLISLLVFHKENNDILQIQRKAWELGIELQDKYSLIVSTTSDNKSSKRIYEIVDHFDKIKPKEHIMIGLDKQNQLIILLPIQIEEENDDYKKEINNLLHEISSQHDNISLISGISQIHDIQSLSLAYNQSIKSLEYAIDFMVTKSHNQFYDDLGIYRLFSNPIMQDEVQKFVYELLTPLIEYDNEHRSDLIHTLQIFLHNRGNYRKTAKEMFVHHNTIRYRLNTINELIKSDIHEYHTQLQFSIALLLYPQKDDDS